MLEIDWTRFFFEWPPRAEVGALPETTDASAHESVDRPLGDSASVSAERAVAMLSRAKASEVRLRSAAEATRARAERAKARAKEAHDRAVELAAAANAATADAKDVAAAEAAIDQAEAAQPRAEQADASEAIADLEAFSTPPGVFARKIDSHLTQILANLPDAFRPPDDRLSTRSLALFDLKRGDRLGLASGQAVATEVQDRLRLPFKIYSNAELGLAEIGLKDGDCPLWFYLLKEAELTENEHGVRGERLGPVGGRIVAEVILGILMRDETSCLRDPTFELVIRPKSEERGLTMMDLLRYAGEVRPNDEN